MKDKELKQIVEGLIFISGDQGITLNHLTSIVSQPKKLIEAIVRDLIDTYEREERGLIIIDDNGFYSLSTRADHSSYYQAFFKTPQSNRLSQAALEVLAIIAYKQPITRAGIEDIRGVKSERPLQTLMSRSLIEEVGRKETIGRPILFGTTKEFLLFFGLQSLEELPDIMEDLLHDFPHADESDEMDLFQ